MEEKKKEKVAYVVDPIEGPYFKIQDAIDAAENNSLIQIAQGLYVENLRIKHKNLNLEARDIDSEVYIMGFEGATISVELLEKQKVTLQGLRMTHKSSKSNFDPTSEISSKLMRKNEIIFMNNVEDYHLHYERINFDERNDSVIFLKSGDLNVKKCLINLNLLVKETQPITPAVLIERGSTINIETCDFKGSKFFSTIGIALRNAHMIMKDTTIMNFKAGGVLMFLTENNNVKLFKSIIANNGQFGIQILGNSQSPNIQYCQIENNNGVGVQICTSNKCSLTKNTICLNKNGVEVISADPFIYDNVIEKNHENGIMVKSLECLISAPKIKKNDILSNVKNGILCEEQANSSKLTGNKIRFNKMAGIKVSKSARVIITGNEVYKNIYQGILITEKSSAHVEKNKVHENIKANIALGGEDSRDTTIIKNEIFKGRCEGIFLIEAGACLINRNNIYQNFDGIICITSIPDILNNKITANKNHGIMLLKDSRPTVINNSIIGNKATGMFVRDKSQAKLKQNIFEDNHVGYVQENKDEYSKDIKKINTIKDEIRSPSEYHCILI